MQAVLQSNFVIGKQAVEVLISNVEMTIYMEYCPDIKSKNMFRPLRGADLLATVWFFEGHNLPSLVNIVQHSNQKSNFLNNDITKKTDISSLELILQVLISPCGCPPKRGIKDSLYISLFKVYAKWQKLEQDLVTYTMQSYLAAFNHKSKSSMCGHMRIGNSKDLLLGYMKNVDGYTVEYSDTIYPKGQNIEIETELSKLWAIS